MPKVKPAKPLSDPSRQQVGALPLRLNKVGAPEVLLLTSRTTRRWVIPKGWTMRKLTLGQAAEREAFEEAGLVGWIYGEDPVGRYQYEKQFDGGDTRIVGVDVFLFVVSAQRDTWPEQAERDTAWFDLEKAARLVAEPELAEVIRRVGQWVVRMAF